MSNKQVLIIDSNMAYTDFDVFGTKRYYKNGELHRDGDKPAAIWPNGTIKYYKNGKLHRDGDEPAVIYSDGTKWYYKNGHLHRDGDKPAFICSGGTKWYYKNGELHRDGDKPAITWPDGSKFYYKNGRRHRDGDKPAFICSDVDEEYYKNGVRYTKEQVEKMEEIRRRILNRNAKSCARYWYDKTFMNPYNFKNENFKKSIKNKQLPIMHNSMLNKRVEFMRKKIFGNGNKKISSLDRSRTIELINEEVDKMKVGVRFWRNDECQTIKEKLYKINNNYWDVQELEEVLNDIEEPKDEDYANILLDLKSSYEPPSLEERVKYLEDRVEYLEDRIRYLLQISIYE